MFAAGNFHIFQVRSRVRSQFTRAAVPWVWAGPVTAKVYLGLVTAALAGVETIEGCWDTLFNPKGMIAGCTEIIDSASASDPQAMLALNNRAGSHESLGDHDAAIDDYSRALAIDPHYGNALYNRGTVYLNMGKLDLAIADFDAVLILNPRRADAYHNRGLALLRLGDNAAAIGDLRPHLRSIRRLPLHTTISVSPAERRAATHERLQNFPVPSS